MNYLELLEDNERTFLWKIRDGLSSHDEVQAMSIIGSLAKGHYSESSDIDILVLVKCKDFSLEKCKVYSDELGFHAELKDDAYDFVYNNRNFSLLFKDCDIFLDDIQDIMDGGQLEIVFKPWAYGGMLTDVLLLDVRNEIIVFDEDGRLKDYSESLKRKYPQKLANALLDYNRDFIRSRIKALKRFSGNPLVSEIIKEELMVSFVRYTYASKGAFNPGLKHIFGKDNLPFLEKNMPELLSMVAVKDEVEKMAELIIGYLGGEA